MLVRKAIEEMRFKLNDKDVINFMDSDLLVYLNEAIQYIASALITYKAPFCVKDVTMTENTMVLPNNFAQLCGTFPIKITGQIMSTNEELPITIRYFESFGDVEIGDEMPFHHTALDKLTVKKACEYAGNQLEMDVSQDKALEQELLQIVGSAMGARL